MPPEEYEVHDGWLVDRLTGRCYRMIGGATDDDDAKQPDEPKPEPSPDAQPVTLGQLREMLAEHRSGIDSRLGTFQASLEAVSATRHFAPQEPAKPAAAPDVTDEDVEAALNDPGKMRALLARTGKAAAAAAIAEFKDREVEPLRTRVEGYGLPAIANITREVVRSQMPLYDTYKAEIDKQINQMTPEAQINPEALKAAYFYVVGQHAADREKAIREEVLREVAANPNMLPGGRQGTRSSKLPTPAELYGADTAAMIEAKGGPDAWAKRLGYASWEDRLTKTQEHHKKGATIQ